MKNKLRIVLAQLNLTVGDIEGNLQKHIDAAITARDELSADLIVFPELSITGYPPEDLLLRPAFIQEARFALEKALQTIQGIYCLIGYPEADQTHLYNACALIYNGEIVANYHKRHLPNYGVFDEKRYFTPGHTPCVVNIHGIPIGLVICEDIWNKLPVEQTAAQGARLILAPNASPFEFNKQEQRALVLADRAQDTQVPIIYVNNVGGQDELVFDGGSMVVGADGHILQHAGFFAEKLFPVDVDFTSEQTVINLDAPTIPNTTQRIYDALVLAVRDYVNKNHFPGVLIGVSGGIDSALTLAIAVDALGKDKVHAVFMPSRYTSEISLEDALELVNHLGVQHESISIEPAYQSFLESLAPSFAGKKPNIAEENIQARCRAILLMALSNKLGYLVLTTGNRSEMATGYCTLYGDMAGGFAVLKDIPKMMVYELSRYRNQINLVIPERTLVRAPTAELAPDQKDEDSLPPYSVLDQILECYLNQSKSIPEIVALGFDRETVAKVVRMIHRNEYKRKQAAIGPHINHKSFGKDWRYPLTSGFKG